MTQIYALNNIKSLQIEMNKPCIVFLKGELAAGKTTLSKYILNHILGIQEEIISPTYTYYNIYGGDNYHFDLYRLKNYDDFFAIGGEDVLDNLQGVALIEWPELIEKYYKPDIEILLRKTGIEDQREIEIIYHNIH